jgi:hypothetical protein
MLKHKGLLVLANEVNVHPNSADRKASSLEADRADWMPIRNTIAGHLRVISKQHGRTFLKRMGDIQAANVPNGTIAMGFE